MTRKSLPTTRAGQRRSMPLTSKASKIEERSASRQLASNGGPCAIRFRRDQPHLPSNPDARGGAQRFRLTFKRTTLTLKQWSRRGQAGIPPNEIWRRLKERWPIDDALGGSAAVTRAIEFVGWHDARAARGHHFQLRREAHQRRVDSVHARAGEYADEELGR